MNIKELVPKDKFDNTNVGKLYSLTNEEIEPIICELLEWIQDYNWPIAQELIPVLKERVNLVFPYIRDILAGDDVMWKYWVMELLIPSFTNIHKNELKEDMIKLMNLPGTDEDAECIRKKALECYNDCGFDD